ncbi:hypothetical protein [Dyadobacter sp. NIV53]|uniref:hypothetical protein n=1 Tax=Dyadobacter sp. NIV53 TaxID=2861765 RepID=UPI0038D374C5
MQEEIEKAWIEKLNSLNDDRIIIGVNKYCSDETPIQKAVSGDYAKNAVNQLRTLPDRNLSESWNESKISMHQ